jgi:lysophospholipase L1-like esterase
MRFLQHAALVVGSVVLVLGAAEVAVRVSGAGPAVQVVSLGNFRLSEDEDQGYTLAPGSRDGRHVISSAGLRDREFARGKPADVFRIAALGDSVTFGSGVDRDGAWPKVLERLLARAADGGGPRPEVLNFGVVGYNARQVAARLRTDVLPFQPDLVLYGYVLNDPQAESVEGAALEELRDAARRGGPPGAGPLRLLAHSRLYVWLRSRWRGRGAPVPTARVDPAYAARGTDERVAWFRALHRSSEGGAILEAALAELARLREAHGVPIRVAVFPLFLEDVPPDALRDVHADVAARFRAAGFPVVDFAEAFRAAEAALGEPLALDFLHPNALGHRVAAAAWLRALRAGGALPASLGDDPDAPLAGPDARIARILAEAHAP